MIVECADCAERFTMYAVNSEAWKQATGGRWGDNLHVCLSCLEARLGRPLSIDDFILLNKYGEVPVNRTLLYAYKMGLRAARQGT